MDGSNSVRSILVHYLPILWSQLCNVCLVRTKLPVYVQSVSFLSESKTKINEAAPEIIPHISQPLNKILINTNFKIINLFLYFNSIPFNLNIWNNDYITFQLISYLLLVFYLNRKYNFTLFWNKARNPKYKKLPF